MEISFKGKSALVTGASRGIGKDIALQLARCGAQVIATARSSEDLASLKKENPSITTISVDLSDWKATSSTLANIGPIDLLVNNAGSGLVQPITEVTEETIDRIFNINVKALINVTQIVIKNLLARKAPGSIVNLSSQASLVGLHHHGVYCASKGAVDAFTRAIALDYGKHNIRANCVNPTVIMTEMGKLWWSDPKVADPLKDKIPLKRFGEVHEVTDAVLYLLSDKSSMITGTALPIDGGFCSI